MKNEFERELELLQKKGLKSNPLRLEYEEKVRELSSLRDELYAKGESVENIARTLHKCRRELGRIYKDAAPPLFREYIFYSTEKKYGDPLGPSYENLKKVKSDEKIIESATRPIENLDNRLTIEGFADWFHQIYKK